MNTHPHASCFSFSFPQYLCTSLHRWFTCQREVRGRASRSKLGATVVIPMECPGEGKEEAEILSHLLDLCGSVVLLISLVPAFLWLPWGSSRHLTQRFLRSPPDNCFFFDVPSFPGPATDKVALFCSLLCNIAF